MLRPDISRGRMVTRTCLVMLLNGDRQFGLTGSGDSCDILRTAQKDTRPKNARTTSFRFPHGNCRLFRVVVQFLNGHSKFTYDEFLAAFDAYDRFLVHGKHSKPSFCESPDKLLQFLYELNVVGYVLETDNGAPFFGLCFRERGTSNIAPKVRTHARYEVHYGLMKALDLGMHFLVAGPGIH